MKNRLKILLIILFSLLALSFASWLFRGDLIGYFLSNLVHKQSEGKARLTIGKVNLNLLEGDILLEKPVFTFDSIFIDKENRYKLNRIAFDTIALKDVSLFQLIRYKKFRARQLLIEKPAIRFEGGLLNGKNLFKPDSLMALLTKHHVNKTSADVRINLVSIHYGSVSLKPGTANGSPVNLVNFTIEMYNLNTSPTPEIAKKQILFSNDVLFEINNFHKMLLPGYTVSLDRAIFSIKKKKVIIDNLLISPQWHGGKNKSRVSLKAGKILLSGLDLAKAEKLSGLNLNSVMIADGYVAYYLPGKMKPKSDTLSKHKISELKKKFKRFELDSFNLKRISFYNVRNQDDTITEVNNIHLMIRGVMIDSSVLADPMKMLNGKQIMLSTDNSRFYVPEKNLTVAFHDCNYSSLTGKLVINDLNLTGDTATSPAVTDIHFDKLSLGRFDAALLNAGHPMSITVSAINPRFNIDLDNPMFKSRDGGNKFSLNHYFHLKEIMVQDASGKIYRAGRFGLDVSGLNFTCINLGLPSYSSRGLVIGKPTLDMVNLKGYLGNKGNSFHTGNIRYRKKVLTVRNVKGILAGKGKTENNRYGFDYAELKGFDPMNALNGNGVKVDTFQVENPVFQGTITLKGERTNDSGNFAFDLPFALDIAYLGLSDADIKLTLTDSSQRPVEINTRLNTQLQNVNPGKRLDASIVDKLKGSVEFSNLNMGIKDHLTRVKHVGFNLSDRSLDLQNLNISFQAGNGADSSFRIEHLNLAKLDVKEIDYPLLIQDDSIVFGNLLVENLQSDVVIKPKKQPSQNNNTSSLNGIKKLFDIVYDSIRFKNIFINISQLGDSASSLFQLVNFNLARFNGKPADKNLFDNIELSFDSITWSDTLNNTFLAIGQARNNPEERNLTIENLKTGDLFRKRDNIRIYDSADFYLNSKRVVFSGIYLEEAIPTKLKVDKLTFSHLDLLLHQINTKKKKTSFNIDMAIIMNYADLMTSLKVDTTLLDDVSLHFHSNGDSTTRSVNINNIALKVSGINIDTTMVSKGFPKIIKNMSIDLRGKSYITGDSLYEIQSGLIRYDFPRKSITVDSFYVMPRYSEKTFFQKAVYQTDRVKVFGKRLEAMDFDFDDFLNTEHIHFGRLMVDQVDLRMFRNMKYPLKPGIYKKMPQDILRSLNRKITIDTVDIRDSYLLYGEYSKKSVKPGMAFFDHFNVMAYNLSNNYSSIPDTTNLKILLSTRVMGDARMDAEILFPLFSTNDDFSMSVKSETIDMTRLNGLTENILGISILRGKGKIASAFISGNNIESGGMLLFRYKKLKLRMYDVRKSQVSSKFFSPVFNFLINDLVLRSNNPRFARPPKKGVVYFKRETQRSVANYLWKSLLSGMLSTMGINTKGQRQEKKSMKKVQNK